MVDGKVGCLVSCRLGGRGTFIFYNFVLVLPDALSGLARDNSGLFGCKNLSFLKDLVVIHH